MSHRVQGQFCQRYAGNPYLTMVDIPHSKVELRTLLRQRRHALGQSQQDAAATALVRSVLQLPAWTDSRHIALYLARDGEIDPGPLETTARDQGKRVYLPVMTGRDSLRFARWDAGVDLVANRLGIPEPPAAAPCRDAHDLDIIFMPLVGWDDKGNRLGMGGGFYDRTLSCEAPREAAAVLVGLAHECQRVDEIPLEGWDVPLDYIATDAALYRGRAH